MMNRLHTRLLIGLVPAMALSMAGCPDDPEPESDVIVQTDTPFKPLSDADGQVQGDGSELPNPNDSTDGTDLPKADDGTASPPDVDSGDIGPFADGADMTEPMDVDAQIAPDIGSDTTEPGVFEGGILIGEIASAFVNLAVAEANLLPIIPSVDAKPAIGACDVVLSTEPAPTPPPGKDAGTITVTNTTPMLVFTPKASGGGTVYSSNLSSSAETVLPGAGGIMAINSDGGADIGAIKTVIQAPQAVIITSPSPSLPTTIKASTPLAISWNADNGDQVVISVGPLDSSYKAQSGWSLLCTLEGDTGSFSIPAAALEAVLGSAGTQNAVVGVTRIRRGIASVGGIQIPVAATRTNGAVVTLKN